MIEDIEKCSNELIKDLKSIDIEFSKSTVFGKTSYKPTLEEARKYFRDNLKIDVFVEPIELRGFLQWTGAYRYTNKTINSYFHEMNRTRFRDSYEDALSEILTITCKDIKKK